MSCHWMSHTLIHSAPQPGLCRSAASSGLGGASTFGNSNRTPSNMADNGTLGRNPFAIKTSTTPTRGSEDQARESRPLVAPPTLVLGQEAPRSSGFVLKPSALSAQASNLKIYKTPTSLNNGKIENQDGDRLSADSIDKKDGIDKKVDSDKDGGAEKNTDSVGKSEPSGKTETEKSKDATDGAAEPKKEEATDDVVDSGRKDDADVDIREDSKVPGDAGVPAQGVEIKLDGKAKLDGPEPAKHETRIPSVAGVSTDGFKQVNELVFGQNLQDRVSNVSESSFVFGQNLRDRVTNAETVDVESKAPADFAEAASVSAEPEKESESPAKGEKRSLNETAEEYQQRMENEAKKSKLEEVEVVTGEEDERNVVQINCKLYIFEGNQYLERGRGVLRLNDKQNPEDGSLQSRVVMRTQGILRVVLNTKVWAGMSVEYANDRSLRMTGQSPEGASAVYLIQCSSREAEQLYNALEWRVQALRNAAQPSNSRVDPDEANNQDDKGDNDNTDSNSNTTG